MLHTENRIFMAADAALIHELAADVRSWPEILRHYRYVRVIGPDSRDPYSGERTVRMAARRSGIPVSWTSRQAMDPAGRRVRYEHIGGVTKGMRVLWTIEPADGGCEVCIVHDLDSPRWLVRLPPVRAIIGRYFVRSIADRTLRGIKAAAEARSGSVTG